ncbi:MAG: hypothetical protein U0Q15_06055 [Kineosporiaceae bacterium]
MFAALAAPGLAGCDSGSDGAALDAAAAKEMAGFTGELDRVAGSAADAASALAQARTELTAGGYVTADVKVLDSSTDAGRLRLDVSALHRFQEAKGVSVRVTYVLVCGRYEAVAGNASSGSWTPTACPSAEQDRARQTPEAGAVVRIVSP